MQVIRTVCICQDLNLSPLVLYQSKLPLCHDKGCSGLKFFLFSSELHQVTYRSWTKMCVLCFSFDFLCKLFSCSKSMMLNKFVTDIFSVSRPVFEIKTITQNFAAKWCYKRFYCVAHGHFTLPRHLSCDYCSFRLKIIGMATDLTGTLYIFFI